MKARFAFRTRDRLLAVDESPDVDEAALVIFRPLKPYPPIAGDPPMRTGFLEHRRYERTNETYQGLPVYEEL